MNENELKHYGVKGMKWGVRKRISESYNRGRANHHNKTARYTQFRASKVKTYSTMNRERKNKFNQKIADLYDTKYNKLNKKANKAMERGKAFIEKLDSNMTMASIRTQHKITPTGTYTFIGPKLVKRRD